MAEENLENNEQNEGNKAGGKKTGLIIIILVVVLLLAAALVFFILYPKYQQLTGTKDETEQVQKEEEKAAGIGLIYKISGLTVNPKNSMGRRFAVFDLALEYSDPQVNDRLNKFQPIILDRLLIYLRSKTIAEYSAPETIDKMRSEMKKIINEVLQQDIISNLYFTRFVLE